MQYRPLGASDIEASVVALGAWAIGGWMWGGTDHDDSIRAIHAAIDAGVNLIDTAPIYGFGVSEDILGAALRDRRDEVLLASKCGMVGNTREGDFKFTVDAHGPNANGLIDIQIHLTPESIRREVERSLKRLKTDHIDLYQTHWQDSTTPIEDTMGTLLDLKQEGKIRAIGACNADPGHLDAYRGVGQLDADQEKYSMLDRDKEQEQLPYCQEHNVAVLAYSPLAQGLVTGKIGPDREFPPGDLRRGNPRFSVENRERVARMLDQFKPVAQAHDISLAQLAIAWTVAQPGLTHALCGARHEKQARENAAAGDVKLTDEEVRTVGAAIDDYAAVLA